MTKSSNSKKKDVDVIVKHLEKDGDELTPENLPYKMKRILLHMKQERKKIPENFKKNINGVDYTIKVSELIEKNGENYKPPHVVCGQISSVMKDILDVHFGHETSIIECYPKHLNKSKHFLVYDKTENKYMDGSTYKAVFQPDKKDWVLLEDAEFVFENGERSKFKLNDIPEEYVRPKRVGPFQKIKSFGNKVKSQIKKKK